MSGPRRWALPALFALALLAVVAILLQGGGGAGSPTSTAASAADVHPVLGQEAAPVLIREYGDFQCPTCGAFERLVEPQIKRTFIDPGVARLEWHDFPWIGAESFAAANAARCAGEQGRFWPYHDLLYQHQGGENSGAFSTARLEALGATLGLNATTFNSCVAGGSHLNAVRADLADAQLRGFNATPTFLIGKQRIVGAQPFDVFQAAIAAALAAK